MRWPIVRTLLYKEARRHLANRGGLLLILLLIVASILLSFFGSQQANQAGLIAGVKLCYVDYAEESPVVAHLRAHVPEDFARAIRFRPMQKVPTDEQGVLQYPMNTGAIQLRPARSPEYAGTIWFWYPGNNRSALAPYEAWFWKEMTRFLQRVQAETDLEPRWKKPWEEEGFALHGGMDSRSGLATALVLFGIFFLCVYLLPSLTCEERERGVLLAQALSPASTWELLAARFLFYPAIGILLAALLAGMYEPRSLTRGFFWLALGVCVTGSMGIGMTIATIARTARTASMGAMCYLMVVSLLLLICQQNGIPGLSYLALEYYSPRIVHAALTGHIQWYHWINLGAAGILATGWALTAGLLFRQQGWQ